MYITRYIDWCIIKITAIPSYASICIYRFLDMSLIQLQLFQVAKLWCINIYLVNPWVRFLSLVEIWTILPCIFCHQELLFRFCLSMVVLQILLCLLMIRICIILILSHMPADFFSLFWKFRVPISGQVLIFRLSVKYKITGTTFFVPNSLHLAQ